MSDFPPITGELRASMVTALDGDTDEELVYCPTTRFADLCDRIDAIHAGLERMTVDETDDSMQTLTIRPFVRDSDKDGARKVVEEAAEAFSAWETLSQSAVLDGIGFNAHIERHKTDLADELADTITACVNLAHRYGIDLQAALIRVEARNRERGRYDG